MDDYLVRVATTLRDACRELTPSTTAASDLDSMKRKRIETRKRFEAVEQEHKRLWRGKLSSKDARKKLNVSRSKKEEEERRRAQRAHEAAEAKRRKESRQREEKRIRAEMEEKERKRPWRFRSKRRRREEDFHQVGRRSKLWTREF